MQHIRYAEIGDIHGMEVIEMETQGCRMLRLNGLIFHSAIVAHHVELHHEQEAVNVQISMSLAAPHMSGRFEVLVPLATGVRCVTFGTARTIVWKGADYAADAPGAPPPQRGRKYA